MDPVYSERKRQTEDERNGGQIQRLGKRNRTERETKRHRKRTIGTEEPRERWRDLGEGWWGGEGGRGQRQRQGGTRETQGIRETGEDRHGERQRDKEMPGDGYREGACWGSWSWSRGDGQMLLVRLLVEGASSEARSHTWLGVLGPGS